MNYVVLESLKLESFVDEEIMITDHLNDTLLNPFGNRDYVIEKDYSTEWVSECCGKEAALELDMSTAYLGGPIGFCAKCHDSVGFIREKEFYS